MAVKFSIEERDTEKLVSTLKKCYRVMLDEANFIRRLPYINSKIEENAVNVLYQVEKTGKLLKKDFGQKEKNGYKCRNTVSVFQNF